MRNKLFSAIIVAFWAVIAPVSVVSWHDEGHMLTGYIAWQQMTPQARASVIRILRSAPEDSNIAAFYKVYGIEPPAKREMQFFTVIPTWADMVRERAFPVRYQKYHHSNWHYYDTFWRQVDGRIEPVKVEEEGGQAMNRLIADEKLLRDPNAKDADKAVAIAWMLHLMGDLHQPLHNSARVTDREPKGDQGGNLFLLTPEGTPREQQLNLHSFWDGITNRSVPIKNGQFFEEYLTRLANKIAKKYPFASMAGELKLGQYQEWHQEGMNLANTVVFSPDLKRFEMPSTKYQKKAYETAERQIALAGYRIAGTLNSIFGSTASTAVAPN